MQHKVNPILIFFAMMFFPFLMWVDFFSVSVILPQLAKGFGVNIETSHWLLTTYSIGYVGFIITATRLADYYGLKRLFLIAVSLFAAGSLCVGLAHQFYMVLFGRFLQGLTSGVLVMTIIAIISTLYSDDERSKWIAWVVGMAGLGMACGPLIGGIVVHFFSWRVIFLVNIPVALIVWIFSYIGLPKIEKNGSQVHFDVPGMVLICMALLIFALAITRSSDWGFFSVNSLILHCIWIGALILFCYCEKKQSSPLIHAEFFKFKNFLIANVVGMVAYFCLTSWMIMSTIYFSTTYHLSPIHISFTFIPFGVMLFVVNFMLPHLAKKIKPRAMVLMGIMFGLMAFFGLALSLFFTFEFNLLAIGALFFGVSFAIINSTTLPLALQRFAANQVTISAGMIQMFRWIGAAIGAPIMSNVFISLGKIWGSRYGLGGSYLILSGLYTLTLIAAFLFLHDRKKDKAL